MKKVMSIVMAGIMAAMMLVVTTGCNSNKEEHNKTVNAFNISMDDGMCKGYIRYVRYGVYGNDAYRYCLMTHDDHVAKGEIVTNIDCVYENGEWVWFFYVAELAG